MDDSNVKKGFLLRLPKPLLDEMRSWAAQDMRSLNGQIEWLLREALRKRGGADKDRAPPSSESRE